MLKDKIKTAQDKKEVDKNGYWYLYDNPITKAGIYPYLGRQINPELEPDKIYQVLRPKEELSKPETLHSFNKKPLTNEHEMLGKEVGTTPAEKFGIHGTLGENAKYNDDTDTVTNNLAIYSEELKKAIEGGKKELSCGYTCRYELTPGEYKGQHYDAIQRDILLNHIALVDEGRMGHDVRIMDCAMDSFKEIATIDTDIKNKEYNQMTENVKQAQDVDKREFIREIMAIAAKPNEDFEGGEEEKIETIAKKLEAISYNPSEAGGNDEAPEEEKKEEEKTEDEGCDPKIKEGEDEDVDKRKLIDEIGSILNGKVDEELVRTIIGKADKLAYNNSQAGGEDEEPEEEKKEEAAPVSMDEAVKYFAKKDELLQKIKPVIGDNCKFSSMTIPQVVKYACDKLDIKNSLDTLEGYLKAKSQTPATVSMDSAFRPAQKSSAIKRYLSDKQL